MSTIIEEQRAREKAELMKDADWPCTVCGNKIGVGGARHTQIPGVIAHPACANVPDKREVKACIDCGYKRKVRVSTEWAYTGTGFKEHWSKRCTACNLDQSAQVDFQRGRAKAVKARAIRERRASKKS